jgi:hypothetical protein
MAISFTFAEIIPFVVVVIGINQQIEWRKVTRDSTQIIDYKKQFMNEDAEQDEHDKTDDAIDDALRCGKSDIIRLSRNSNEFSG